MTQIQERAEPCPLGLRKQFHIEDGTKAIVEATPDGILLADIAADFNACFKLRRNRCTLSVAESDSAGSDPIRFIAFCDWLGLC